MHNRKEKKNPYTNKPQKMSELDEKFNNLQSELVKLPAVKSYMKYLLDTRKRVPGCLQKVTLEEGREKKGKLNSKA